MIVQPRAEEDIRKTAFWLREQSRSSAIALRWVRALRAKIATLADQPLRCPVDPDSEVYGEEIRLLLFGRRHARYRILFALREDKVHIVTVRHAAQQSLADETGTSEEPEIID